MKKILLTASLLLVFSVYVLLSLPSPANQQIAVTTPRPVTTTADQIRPSNNAPAASPPPEKKSSAPPAASASAPQAQREAYKDGRYTGSIADAFYGNVQVQVTIQGGRISDVQFLQYPNTHSYSIYVNSQAMPYLAQEAIQAQNANVDIISGATQTSQAFQESLASALSQAKV